MQENDNAAKISAIIGEHRAAIETLDNDIMMAANNGLTD